MEAGGDASSVTVVRLQNVSDPDVSDDGGTRKRLRSVILYRECLESESRPSHPRFQSLSSLLDAIRFRHDSDASDSDFDVWASDENFEVFCDLSCLSNFLKEDVFTLRQADSTHKYYNYLGLGNLQSMPVHHVDFADGRTYYPLVDDNAFERVVSMWLSGRPERMKFKRVSAFEQILLLLNGGVAANTAETSGVQINPVETHNFRGTIRAQQLHGLHELWELGLDHRNHTFIPDTMLEKCLEMLRQSDRSSEEQIFISGALQAFVACSDVTRDRLRAFQVVFEALDCLKNNTSMLILQHYRDTTIVAAADDKNNANACVEDKKGSNTSSNNSAILLLKLLSQYADEAASRAVLLDNINFFIDCIGANASSELVCAVLSVFLRVLSLDAYSMQSSCDGTTVRHVHDHTSSGDQRCSSNLFHHFPGLPIGTTYVLPEQLLEFVRESMGHAAKPHADFSLKVSSLVLLADLCCAAEQQSTFCVEDCLRDINLTEQQDNGDCSNKLARRRSSSSRHLLTFAGNISTGGKNPDPYCVPLLHSVRELVISSKVAPMQVTEVANWVLCMIACAANDTPLPTSNSSQAKLAALLNHHVVDHRMSNGNRLEGVRPAQTATADVSATAECGSELGGSDYLRMSREYLDVVRNPVMSGPVWEARLYTSGIQKEYYDANDLEEQREHKRFASDLATALDHPSMVLETLFHCASVLCEWAVCFCEQSRFDATKTVRYKHAPHFPTAGTRITDKEVYNVFECLAHMLGFTREPWVRSYAIENALDTDTISFCTRVEVLCMIGIEQLLAIPQAASRLMRIFKTKPARERKHQQLEAQNATSVDCFTDDYEVERLARRQRKWRQVAQAANKTTTELDMRIDPVLDRHFKIGDDIKACASTLGQYCPNTIPFNWPLSLMTTWMPLHRCKSARAEERSAQCVLHLFSTGAAGYALIAEMYSLAGLLDMLMYSNLRFQRTAICHELLTSAVLLFTYGPVGLNSDLDVVDKAAPLLGVYAEENLSCRENEDKAFGSSWGENFRKEAMAVDNPLGEPQAFTPSVLCQLARCLETAFSKARGDGDSNHIYLASQLGMAIWAVARNKRNCVILDQATNVVFTLLTMMDFASQGLLKQQANKTPAIHEQFLELAESSTAALWLLTAQQISPQHLGWTLASCHILPRLFFQIQVLTELIEDNPVLQGDRISISTNTSTNKNGGFISCVKQRIMKHSISFAWSVVDNFDVQFLTLVRPCNQHMLQSVYRLCHNANILPATRCNGTLFMFYIASKAEQVLARMCFMCTQAELVNVRASVKITLGSDALILLYIKFLREENSQLRSTAALLVGQTHLRESEHNILRERGCVLQLLDLATHMKPGQEYEQRCAAMGLLNCAESGTSQELIVKHGFYRLLICLWLAADSKHTSVFPRIISAVLSRVSSNPNNRTRMYQAELRSKEIAGWHDVKEPDSLVGSSSVSGGTGSEEKSRFSCRSRKLRKERAGKDGDHMEEDKNVEDIRDVFLMWVDELETHLDKDSTDRQAAESDLGMVAAMLRSRSGQDMKRASLKPQVQTRWSQSPHKKSVNSGNIKPFSRVRAPNESPLWPYRDRVLPNKFKLKRSYRNKQSVDKEHEAEICDNVIRDLRPMCDGIDRIVRVGQGERDSSNNQLEVIRLPNENEEEKHGVDPSTIITKNKELSMARTKAMAITMKTALSPSRPSPAESSTSDNAMLPRRGNQSPRKGKFKNDQVSTGVDMSEKFSKHSCFTRGQTLNANTGFGQRMRTVSRMLWEVGSSSSQTSTWNPRLVKVTTQTIKAKCDTFVFRQCNAQHQLDAQQESPSEYVERISRKLSSSKVKKTATMAVFTHVPGSRVHNELPIFEAPSGVKSHIYFTGDEHNISEHLDLEGLNPSLSPVTLFALGRVPVSMACTHCEAGSSQKEWNAVVSRLELSLPGEAPLLAPHELVLLSKVLPISLVHRALGAFSNMLPAPEDLHCFMVPRVQQARWAAQMPPTHSQSDSTGGAECSSAPLLVNTLNELETQEEGQQGTAIKWTQDGRVLDDALPLAVRVPTRVRVAIDEYWDRLRAKKGADNQDGETMIPED